MILSKLTARPLQHPNVLVLMSIKYRTSSATSTTIRTFSINNNGHSIKQNAFIRKEQFMSKKGLLVACEHLGPISFSIRTFRPPNSYYEARRKTSAVVMDGLATLVALTTLICTSFHVNYIWSLLPQIVRSPFEKAADLFVRLFKSADSYNKDEVDRRESNRVVDDCILKSSMGRGGGFRDRKIIEYENRIRLYSNPDKIFRYFSSIKINYGNGESEIYMTPDDFLRALTPGVKQPDGLGLDQYKKVDLSKNNASGDSIDLSSLLSQISGTDEFKYPLKADSIFYKLSQSGLINFTDFLFLLTVISVSKRHFEIAFRMFDLNGDGNVEYHEFEKVQSAILAQTSIGKKMGSNVHYKGISSALSKYFFGDDLSNKLTITNFLNFQSDLQTELLTLEFEQKAPKNGQITEMDFAELLVAYAVLNEKKRARMLKRVAHKFEDNEFQGISLQEYLDFFKFLQNINDIDIALTFHNIAGASIDQATLKHVASTVAHVQLSDHLVKVVFTLFDENDDGQLSNKEFVSVLKERLRRGLSKPKDTGLIKILQTIGKSIATFNF